MSKKTKDGFYSEKLKMKLRKTKLCLFKKVSKHSSVLAMNRSSLIRKIADSISKSPNNYKVKQKDDSQVVKIVHLLNQYLDKIYFLLDQYLVNVERCEQELLPADFVIIHVVEPICDY